MNINLSGDFDQRVGYMFGQAEKTSVVSELEMLREWIIDELLEYENTHGEPHALDARLPEVTEKINVLSS